MDYLIPVMKPRLPRLEDVKGYLELIDDGNTYSNRGPLVRGLEKRFAGHLGVASEVVVAVSSGTMALEALAVSRLRADRKFAVPDYTFAASALAIQRAGAKFHLSDVLNDAWLDASTFDLDQEIIPVPVAPFGEISRFSEHHSQLDELALFDFAAALLNVIHQGISLKGNSVAFSLHATKCLGCGEGGLVLARDSEEADFVRSFINFGFSGARVSRQAGTNGKMSEISAAYALASLDLIDKEISDWTAVREEVSRVLLPEGVSQYSSSDSLTPYWIVNTPSPAFRAKLESFLASRGIETRAWWPSPLSRMSQFAIEKKPKNPNALFLSQTQLGLPFFRDLTKSDVDLIQRQLSHFTFE